MENERRYRRRNSDVKEENMESSEQEPRTVRHEYGSSSAGDSIGQARRVIDELEARINDARRVPMSKTLSIIDTGELIDLIGQLRIVLPHTVVQAQAILDERKKILGEAKEEAKASTGKADAYYTEKVENAKRFEQDVKMEADAYDKQIRQKAQEDSNAIIADANTRAEQIVFNAQICGEKCPAFTSSSRRRSWWRTTKSPAAPRLTPLKRASAPKRTRTASTTRPACRWTRCSPARRRRFPAAPASWRHSETIC